MIFFHLLAQTSPTMHEIAIPLWAQLGVAAVFLGIALFTFSQARKAIQGLHTMNQSLSKEVAQITLDCQTAREGMLKEFDTRRAKDIDTFAVRLQDLQKSHTAEMIRNRDIISNVEAEIRALLTTQLTQNTAVLAEVKEIIENHTGVIEGNRADIVKLGLDLKEQIGSLPTAINAPILERFDALSALLSGIDHGISEAAKELQMLRALVNETTEG